MYSKIPIFKHIILTFKFDYKLIYSKLETLILRLIVI